MAFHQVTSKNFRVVAGEKRTLNIDLGGKVLLFIKMEGCAGCSAFFPIFQELARMDKRVNYAVFDITSQTEKSVVRLSRDTTTPIETVPLILIYNNGVPYAKYRGKKTLEGVQGFITSISMVIDSESSHQRSFVQDVPAPKQGYPPSFRPPPHQGGRGGPGYYEPEMGSSSKTQSKGNQLLNDVDDDDDDILMLPDEITPYNTPWKSDFKKFTVD